MTDWGHRQVAETIAETETSSTWTATIIGHMHIHAQLGATRINTMLGSEHLRLGITDRHRISEGPGGDHLDDGVVLIVEPLADETRELIREQRLSDSGKGIN
jgi:hypothetical protein